MIQKNIKFGEIQVLSSTSTQSSRSKVDIIYVENRPSEKGRAAIIKRTIDLNSNQLDLDQDDGEDLTLGNYNARSGVHEYGGGAIKSFGNGDFVFTDYNPQSFGVYSVEKIAEDGRFAEPKLITPGKSIKRVL